MVFIEELRDLTSCPVNWAYEAFREAESDWTSPHLLQEWLRCLANFEANSEAAIVAADLQQAGKPVSITKPDMLLHICEGLRSSREFIVQNYLQQVGFLVGLKFVPPGQTQSGKHYRPRLSNNEMRSISAGRGPALHKTNRSEEDLRSTFWLWFERAFSVSFGNYYADPEQSFSLPNAGALWHDFSTGIINRIALSTVQEIGVSDGKLTNCIAYDFDFSTKHVHTYPVTEDKAISIVAPFPLLTVEMSDQ